jgi:hypothetical protein
MNGMNGMGANAFNLMGGNSNSAAAHFAQMMRMSNNHPLSGRTVSNDDDDRESIKSDSDSRSLSPQSMKDTNVDADDNCSDRSTSPISWSWKMACSICNRICSSATELESHIQSHFASKAESNGHNNNNSTKESRPPSNNVTSESMMASC